MVDIVVLVKQVPEIDKVKFDIEGGTIDRSSAGVEINPFDLNALEAAIQIKEELGGTITSISMGPLRADLALRDTLARGATRAILLTDKKFSGSDTLATSYALASAIRKLGRFDLVICGEKTVDGDTGQVGPEVAEHLKIPHVAYVSRIVKVQEDKLEVISEFGRNNYILEIRLPALITVTKDINNPRLPTLQSKLNARKSKIEVFTANSLADVADINRFGFTGSPTWVSKVTIPTVDFRKGKIFGDGPADIEKFVKELKNEGIL